MKRMKKFNNYIRYFDLFGRKINLNFDKNGDNLRSSIGGYLSISFMIFISYFMI